MRRTVAGHRVRTEPCDGLRDHHRVFADGMFCGLIACDGAGWHTIPAIDVGRPAPPICHTPTQHLAMATIVAETFPNNQEATT